MQANANFALLCNKLNQCGWISHDWQNYKSSLCTHTIKMLHTCTSLESSVVVSRDEVHFSDRPTTEEWPDPGSCSVKWREKKKKHPTWSKVQKKPQIIRLITFYLIQLRIYIRTVSLNPFNNCVIISFLQTPMLFFTRCLSALSHSGCRR